MKKIYLYHEYESEKEYQTHLRTGGKCHDNMVVAGILFTQDEYDMKGRIITYGNKKHGEALTITTADRYGAQGFTDAIVDRDKMTSWRTDITYIE